MIAAEVITRFTGDVQGIRQSAQQAGDVVKRFENNTMQSFTSMTAGARALGVALGASFSVVAVTRYIGSIVQLGGKLKDLEEQTGISGQLLSGMKSTIEESGSSIDTFARGIGIAQKNLGQINSEADQAAIAIRGLGLDFNKLRDGSPEQFLKLVVEALSKTANQFEFNAKGAQIFGRAFVELGPILRHLAGNFEELRRKGLTQADIDMLDAAGDAWTRMSNRIAVATGTVFVTAIRRIQDTVDQIRELKAALNLVGIGGVLRGEAGGLKGTREAFDVLVESADKFVGKAPTNPFVAPTGKPEAIKAIKEAQIELERLSDGFSEFEEAAFKASEAVMPIFKQLRDLNLTPLERQMAEINDRFDEMSTKIRIFGEATRQDITPFLEDLEYFRSQELLKLEPDMDSWDLPEAPMISQIKESKTAWEDLFSTMGTGLQSAFDGMIRGTQTWGQTWRSMLANIAVSVVSILGNSLAKGFGGGVGGVVQLSGPGMSSYAAGGVVPGSIGAPQLAMVHGGETIVPYGSGKSGGGQPNVNVTVNGSIIPNPGVTRDQVIQIGIEQFDNRGMWTQAYENRRSRG